MNRLLAIVEREMRKFFRSPVLMIMSNGQIIRIH